MNTQSIRPMSGPRRLLAATVLLLVGLAGHAPSAHAAAAPVDDFAVDTPQVIVRHAGPDLRVASARAAAAYTIVLSEAPSEDVIVRINVSRSLAANRSAVRFTPENWYFPQSVRLTASGRAKATTGYVQHSVASGDAAWYRVPARTIPVRLGPSRGYAPRR